MDNFVNIIISPIAPLTKSLNISLPRSTPLSSLPQHITTRLAFPNLSPSQLIVRHSSRLLPTTSTLQTLQNVPSDPVFLQLSLRLPGGKGGFGSQLRAQGGRMASRRNRGPQDKTACRDLSGRRIKAVEQAKQLAEFLAKEPGLKRAAREEKRRKLEAVITQQPPGVKMDDHAYWEDKDKLVEGVKSAVKDAIRAARDGGGRVEVVHTVTVQGGGVKRDVKFAGFEEEYDSDSEEETEEEDELVNEEGADEQGDEDSQEDEYESSTEEEDVKINDVKGKGIANK
jgi:hypothetical protein